MGIIISKKKKKCKSTHRFSQAQLRESKLAQEALNAQLQQARHESKQAQFLHDQALNAQSRLEEEKVALEKAKSKLETENSLLQDERNAALNAQSRLECENAILQTERNEAFHARGEALGRLSELRAPEPGKQSQLHLER